MKKIILSTLLYVATTVALFAQDAEKERYAILYNDPYEIKPVKISIVPMYADVMLINRSAGAGIHAHTYIGRSLSLEVLARHAYMDHNFKNQHKNISVNPITFSHAIEVGGEFHLIDGLVQRNLLVSLPDDPDNASAQTLAINARKIFALRGGYNYFANSIKASNEFPLISADKQFGNRHRVNYTTHNVYLGITTKRIDRVGIMAGSRGERQKNRQRQFYADVMYGTPTFNQLHLDSALIYNVENTPFSNFGARVGGQWLHNRLFSRVEMGFRPAPTSRPYYIMAAVGFTLIGNEPRAKE